MELVGLCRKRPALKRVGPDCTLIGLHPNATWNYVSSGSRRSLVTDEGLTAGPSKQYRLHFCRAHLCASRQRGSSLIISKSSPVVRLGYDHARTRYITVVRRTR